MTSDSGNAREILENFITQLKEGFLWIHFNCTRLSYFLEVYFNIYNFFITIFSFLRTSLVNLQNLYLTWF